MARTAPSSFQPHGGRNAANSAALSLNMPQQGPIMSVDTVMVIVARGESVAVPLPSWSSNDTGRGTLLNGRGLK